METGQRTLICCLLGNGVHRAMAGLETQPLNGLRSVTAEPSQGLQSEPAAQVSRREVFFCQILGEIALSSVIGFG